MKKKLLAVLSVFFIASLGAVTFTACRGHGDSGSDSSSNVSDSTDSGSSSQPETYYSVSFPETEGVKFSSEDDLLSVKRNDRVSFTVTVGAFYSGTPVVTANGTTLEGQENEKTYTYSLRVREDIQIEVSGVSRAVSNLANTGVGTSESPYLIREPIDLLYMAEQVNAGYEAYVCGYFRLENSIDLQGEELEIIGNGSTEHSFFAGIFSGLGHTISNFRIESTEYDYVGLFGIVQAYETQNLGRGGTIYNLNIENYSISATSTGNTLICGSLVAQGFGANIGLCNAKNGTLEVNSDRNNFAYVGGLVGIQRSFTSETTQGTAQYFSELTYSSADIEITGNSGAVFIAGGIVGYVFSADETTVATVTNCYFTGSVSGAFYTGGIAGWLAANGAVENCYSAGYVSAQSNITDTLNSLQYCYANAGGVVGMAERDTAIVDCFSNSELRATSQLGSKYNVTKDILAASDAVAETAYGSHPASVFNCYGKNDGVNFTNPDSVKNKLRWHDTDWTFEEGKYPVVNTEAGEEYEFTLTLDFGDKSVAGENEEDIYQLPVNIGAYYKPMTFWYQNRSIGEQIYGKNGYSSYGYFFDEDFTVAVPYGYIPTRNITLYAAFADYKQVEGTYYILTSNPSESVRLELKNDGTFTCVDSVVETEGTYIYNGEEIYFYSANFDRYYVQTTTSAAQNAYNFKATIEGDRLVLVGGESGDGEILIPDAAPLYAVKGEGVLTGTYYYVKNGTVTIYSFFSDGTGNKTVGDTVTAFTYTLQGNTLSVKEDQNTLTGTKTETGITLDGSVLTETDSFAGVWEMDSASKRYYTFDGAGNWKYVYYGYRYDSVSGQSYLVVLAEDSGTYTLSNEGTADLGNGTTAAFDDNGMLKITATSGNVFAYGKSSSYFGKWNSTGRNNATLALYGIDKDGIGKALITYSSVVDGKRRNEIYDLEYSADILTSGSICLYYSSAFYGILSYNATTGLLSGQLFSLSESSYVDISFRLTDDYTGEWISDEPAFEIVNFNGYGIYKYNTQGTLSPSGRLTIDGESVNYILEDSTMEGYFYYKNEVYRISYDEITKNITVSYGDTNSQWVRKDALTDKTFIDDDENTYTFDGRGALPSGGKLSVLNANNNQMKEYIYRITTEGIKVFDNNDVIALIDTVTDNDGLFYFWKTTTDTNGVKLAERTVFTGTWAVSASYSMAMEIGTMDLNNRLVGCVPASDSDGNLTNLVSTTFTMVDDQYLTCEVNGTTFYVIQIAEKQFVLSPNLNWFNYDGTYGHVMMADSLFGNWTNALGATYQFDGMGLSEDVFGMSRSYMSAGNYTSYYYRWFAKDAEHTGFLIINATYGSQVPAQLVTFCEIGTSRSYTSADGQRAFTLTPVQLSDYMDSES